MDFNEAIAAEGHNLEKAARKLVDTTQGEPGQRQELIQEINARMDSREMINNEHLYPILRVGAMHEEAIDEYRSHIESIRGVLAELERIGYEGTDDFQRSAEILNQEVNMLTRWERDRLLPLIREGTADAEKEVLGDEIRSEQKRIILQEA